MSKQAKRIAESLTVVTSRRGFLGRLARIAGGASAGIAAVLAAVPALGARPERKPCYYTCRSGEPVLLVKYVPTIKDCPKKWKNCILY